tara:strand:- start:6 stop:1559 length:1554 start_codon:yes stop_codon:yes gene_type:complete
MDESLLQELEQALVAASDAKDDAAASAIAKEIDVILTGPKTAKDVASQFTSFWDGVTENNRPEFDVEKSAKRLGISTAMGAGIGAISPDPMTTALGAAAGFTGGLSEEVGRAIGVSDLTRTGMGVVGSLGVELLPMAYRFLRTRLTAPTPIISGRVGMGGGGGGQEVISDRVQLATLNKMKTQLFGKKAFDISVEPKNVVDTQVRLHGELLGSPNISGESVSTILRQQLYDSLKTAKNSTTKSTVVVSPAKYDAFGKVVSPKQTKQVVDSNIFIKSPEFKSLLKDLFTLSKTPQRAPMGDKRNLIKILKNELDPKVDDSAKTLLNLIQNGGVYTVSKKGGDAETKQLITEEMRAVLKTRFDDYLERTVGAKKYQQLKYAEKEEFIALAKDYIPELLNNKWRLGNPSYKAVIDTVKNNPETRVEYAKALNQHLLSLDSPKAIRSEFIRLNDSLKQAKILDSKKIRSMFNEINLLEKNFAKEKGLMQIKSLISTAITGAVSEETANIIVPSTPASVYAL